MFNIKVEYDSRPIRHIAVQCPKCSKWFNGWDIVVTSRYSSPFEELRYDYNINWVGFTCPICEEEFGGMQNGDKPNIEECSYPEIYDDVLTKKEVWE